MIQKIKKVVKMSATNHSEEIHITLLKKSQDFQEKTINWIELFMHFTCTIRKF